MKRENVWTLKDVIFVTMLCVVFGVVYLGGVYLASFIGTALAPMGLSMIGNELVFGVWFMAATLAAYIIQKPTVAVAAEVLSALIEVLMGNMYGPIVIVSGIVQGAGAEIAFAAFRYRRFDGRTMYLAAAGCCVTSFLWSFVRSGYGKLSLGLLAVCFLIRLVSSLLFSGLLCRRMGDALAKTGLLKGYALGRGNG